MAHAVRRQLSCILRSQRSPVTAGFAGPPSARSFSASAARHENIEETLKWRKITAAGYIVCITLGIYNFVGEEHHEHHERAEYSYLHIRNKEFPWGPDGLFEVKHDH